MTELRHGCSGGLQLAALLHRYRVDTAVTLSLQATAAASAQSDCGYR